MKMSTFGPVSASPRELLAAASKALQELRTASKLLVVFTPPAEDPKPILASLSSLGDIPLVGATNGGAAFTQRGVIQDGAVIAYIDDQSAPMVRARHGFAAIEGSREMKVTETEGNTVVSLDHRPAMEAYQEELARLQLVREGESFLNAATRHSLGIRSLWGEKLKIRTPIGTTGHSLVFVGSIPLGSSVRLVRSTPARMAEVSKQMISEVLAEKDAATLIIDCAVRWKLLGRMNQKQVEADLLESQGPVLGFTSYGEIAKYPGEMDCFYNMSTIAAAW